MVKNTGKAASITLINNDPAGTGNHGFIIHTTGGTTTTSFAKLQGYYGASVAGSTPIQLNPEGGKVLVGITTSAGAYTLQVSGSVYADAYFESSDIREKDVVLTKEGIDGIDTITYYWKNKRDEKTHIGYSAQTILEIIPDAVEEKNNGYLTIDYNQVHTFKISQLEQKIKELEAKLNSLL